MINKHILFIIIICYNMCQSGTVTTPLTGVNNVKATDRRSRYGSDGAQPCAQHRKPWLYRLYFQPFP
uniref:Uncharacterized protein n=1 Tax=Escherichia coli O1:H20 TaxID=1963781 RepID=A0A1S6PTG2_ECOLX|nr:hypothetical protein [Escherichia coli O1:H20]